MCGRFTLKAAAISLQELFDLADVPTLPPRYNIAPTQTVPAVRMAPDAGKRELVMLRWGLIPSWAKDKKIGYSLINARSDTVATKPSFRSAFKSRRCLVAADGYYEWQKVGDKKQPHYFCRADGKPFAFAGLWEHWEGGDGEVIESCSLLTTEPNDLARTVHDRMPVILDRKDFGVWLDPDNKDAKALSALLCPCPTKGLTAYAVSTAVNNPSNNSPACCERMAS